MSAGRISPSRSGTRSTRRFRPSPELHRHIVLTQKRDKPSTKQPGRTHMGQDIARELVTRNGAHRTGDCACCQFGSLSRRRFMAAAGAFGATAMLPEGVAVAQPAPNLIDTHHHFYAPAYQKAWLDWEDARKIPHFQTQVNWSRAGAIQAMDQAGVRAAVLSVASTPGVWFDLSPADAARMARTCNDYGAE